MHLLSEIWHYKILQTGNLDIHVSNVILAILLILFGLKFHKRLQDYLQTFLTHYLVTNKHSSKVLSKVFEWVLIALYCLTVLEIANIPVSSFAFIGGGVALGVGLGAKDLINNFISSIIIIAEGPLKIGDLVSIGKDFGLVTSIGARCITILSRDNAEILIPNSKFVQESLTNWTLSKKIVKSRSDIKIKKDQQQDCTKLIKTLEKKLQGLKLIIAVPAPRAYLLGIEADSFIFRIEFSYKLTELSRPDDVQSEVNLAMVEQFSNQFSIVHYFPSMIKG